MAATLHRPRRAANPATLLTVAILLTPFVRQGHATALEDALFERQLGYPKVAFEMLVPLAQEGIDPEAQFQLADMMMRGEGTRKDPAQALQWLMRAARHGHRKAMLHLGQLYRDGVGTPRLGALAYMWVSMAAPEGVEERLSLEAMLPSGELVQGRTLLARFGKDPEWAVAEARAALEKMPPVKPPPANKRVELPVVSEVTPVKKSAKPPVVVKPVPAKKSVKPPVAAKPVPVKKVVKPLLVAKPAPVKKTAKPPVVSKSPSVKKSVTPSTEIKPPLVEKKKMLKPAVVDKSVKPLPARQTSLPPIVAKPTVVAKPTSPKKLSKPLVVAKVPVIKKVSRPPVEVKAPLPKKLSKPPVMVKASESKPARMLPVAPESPLVKKPVAKRKKPARSKLEVAIIPRAEPLHKQLEALRTKQSASRSKAKASSRVTSLPPPQKPPVASKHTMPLKPPMAVLAQDGVKRGAIHGVQISSCRELGHARASVVRLRAKGYVPFILKMVSKGGQNIWYTVHIGRYQQRAEADAAARAFTQKEGQEAMAFTNRMLASEAWWKARLVQ